MVQGSKTLDDWTKYNPSILLGQYKTWNNATSGGQGYECLMEDSVT